MPSLFKIYFFALLFLCLPFSLFSEGTKQLAPSSSDRIMLLLNDANYNSFGTYNGTDDQRIYFHIDNPASEQVFLGFSQSVSSGHFPCAGSTPTTSYFRIKDPTGRLSLIHI